MSAPLHSSQRRLLLSALKHSDSDAESRFSLLSHVNAESRRHGCRSVWSPNILALPSASTMGTAGRPGAYNSTAGGARGTRLYSVSLPTGCASPGRMLGKRLYVRSSLVACVLLLPCVHLHCIRYALCWMASICHFETTSIRPSRVYVAAPRRQRNSCRARSCHGILATLLWCILASVVLGRHFLGRTHSATSTSRSHTGLYPLPYAECGVVFAAAGTALPFNVNSAGSNISWSPEVLQTPLGDTMSQSQRPKGGAPVMQGQLSRSRSSGVNGTSAITVRKDLAALPTPNAAAQSFGHMEVRVSPLNLRTYKGVAASNSLRQQMKLGEEHIRAAANPIHSAGKDTTGAAGSTGLPEVGEGRAVSRDSPAPETCAAQMSGSGGVIISCGPFGRPSGDAQGAQPLRKAEQVQQLATDGQALDGRPQQLLSHSEEARGTISELSSRGKRTEPEIIVTQHRSESPSGTSEDTLLLQHRTLKVRTSGQPRRRPSDSELREREFQQETKATGRVEDASRSQLYNWDHPLAQDYQTESASAPKVAHALENDDFTTWAVPFLKTQTSPVGDKVEGSFVQHPREERMLSKELKGAQNTLMADITAHLSRLWRKHWLHALEAVHPLPYQARLRTLHAVIEQLDVAINSVILSRPRGVSVGLEKWLHKVREVFTFVFSARMRLSRASASLRPVGPLASTAHDIPEESADVVEVVTSASQRVLVLAPANRKENAGCIVGGPQDTWQRIQDSLFPPSVEAQLAETRASLAKLFDFLDENVSPFRRDQRGITAAEIEDMDFPTSSDANAHNEADSEYAESSHKAGSASDSSIIGNGLEPVGGGNNRKSIPNPGSGYSPIAASINGTSSSEDASSALAFAPENEEGRGTGHDVEMRSSTSTDIISVDNSKGAERKPGATMDVSGIYLGDPVSHLTVVSRVTPTAEQTEEPPPSSDRTLSVSADLGTKADGRFYDTRYTLETYAPARLSLTKVSEEMNKTEKPRTLPASNSHGSIGGPLWQDTPPEKLFRSTQGQGGLGDKSGATDLAEFNETSNKHLTGRPGIVGFYEEAIESGGSMTSPAGHKEDKDHTFTSGTPLTGASPPSDGPPQKLLNETKQTQSTFRHGGRADSFAHLVYSDPDDFKGYLESVRATEEAAKASQHQAKNDAEGSRKLGSETLLSSLHRGKSTAKGSAAAGSRAIPVYMAPESSNITESLGDSTLQAYSGGQRVTLRTIDISGKVSALSSSSGSGGIQDIPRISAGSADESTVKGRQTAARLESNAASESISTLPRDVQISSGDAVPTGTTYSKQQKGSTSSSRVHTGSTDSIRRRQPDMEGVTAASEGTRDSSTTGSSSQNIYMNSHHNYNRLSRQTDHGSTVGITVSDDSVKGGRANSSIEDGNSGRRRFSASASGSAPSLAGGAETGDDCGTRKSASSTVDSTDAHTKGAGASESELGIKGSSRGAGAGNSNKDTPTEQRGVDASKNVEAKRLNEGTLETRATSTQENLRRSLIELIESLGNGGGAHGSSRRTSSTDIREAIGDKERRERRTTDHGSSGRQIQTTDSPVAGDGATHEQSKENDDKSNNDASRYRGNQFSGGSKNPSNCNKVRTEGGGGAVYCITEDTDENIIDRRGDGGIVEGPGSQHSVSQPARRFEGTEVKEESPEGQGANDAFVPGEVLQQEAPQRLPTSALSANTSSFHESRVPTEQQGYTVHRRVSEAGSPASSGNAYQARGPSDTDKNQMGIKIAQRWHLQPGKLSHSVVLSKESGPTPTSAAEPEQPLPSGIQIQQKRSDKPQQSRNMPLLQQTRTDGNEPVILETVPPHNEASEQGRHSSSGQRNPQTADAQEPPVAAGKEEAGKLAGDYARKTQRIPLSEKRAHVDVDQRLKRSSTDRPPQQATPLSVERQQHQDNQLPSSHTAQQQAQHQAASQQTVEQRKLPSLQPHTGRLKLPVTVQTSSEEQQVLVKEQQPRAGTPSMRIIPENVPQPPPDQGRGATHTFPDKLKDFETSLLHWRDSQPPHTRSVTGDAHHRAAGRASAANEETGGTPEGQPTESPMRNGVPASSIVPQSPSEVKGEGILAKGGPLSENKEESIKDTHAQMESNAAVVTRGFDSRVLAPVAQRERLQKPSVGTQFFGVIDKDAGGSDRGDGLLETSARGYTRGSHGSSTRLFTEESSSTSESTITSGQVMEDKIIQNGKQSPVKRAEARQPATGGRRHHRAHPRREVHTHSESEGETTTHFWRTQEHLKRRQALRHQETPPQATRKDAARYPRHREAHGQDACEKTRQQQVVRLQTTLHPVMPIQRGTSLGNTSGRSTTVHIPVTRQQEVQSNRVFVSPTLYHSKRRKNYRERKSSNAKHSRLAHRRTHTSQLEPHQKPGERQQPHRRPGGAQPPQQQKETARPHKPG